MTKPRSEAAAIAKKESTKFSETPAESKEKIEGGSTSQVQVDADFKDREAYEVFCPEGSEEPWHIVVSMKEDEKFTHWALLQMLQARDWETDFEWAVFMKTGRVGSSGLRHFSKKFTDGAAAFKTFAEWFSDKTGCKWLGDFTTTNEHVTPIEGKYLLLSAEEGKTVLEAKSDKERPRPKLGKSDVPVDIYFKDRDDYQVYVTPDGELWTAVMSIKQGSRHTQYAILQVLVAKPETKVEFEFVVFLRHGKVGGSAQRYAKRYTVEVAALSTFQQWFKEKTANEWYGSFKDTLEDFEPVNGKFVLLDRAKWHEVVEFEERSNVKLTDSGVPVDAFYRDKDHYRVYHTEVGDLWAAVLSRKDDGGTYKKFILLQLLGKVPDSQVEFEFVVLKRNGERGESGQWTAKKFTNELDALRTFKMWYQDESGNQWKGSFKKSLEEFEDNDEEKLVLVPFEEWDDVTSEEPSMLQNNKADPSKSALNALLASSRKNRQKLVAGASKPNQSPSSKASENTPAPKRDGLREMLSPVKLGSGKKVAPKVETFEILVGESTDEHFEHRDKYEKVAMSAKMLLKEASGKVKFYSMQLVAANDPLKTPEAEKFCFYVRTGRLGSPGASNFKFVSTFDNGKKSFLKKFQEKTKNEWMGSYEQTLAVFTPTPGEYQIVREFGDSI